LPVSPLASPDHCHYKGATKLGEHLRVAQGFNHGCT
jgi:hypothetical protein